MISVWRLCRAKWRDSAFDGRAAADYPGRWNEAGIPAVYTAESRSLCALEILAHVSRRATLAHMDYLLFEAALPPEIIKVLKRLPRGWDARPFGEVSQKAGTLALTDTAVLRVPSVVTPGEFCYVLNPRHPDFRKIELGKPQPFSFDPRLSSG